MPPPVLLRLRPVTDAEHVLVCTYTADLRFFERIMLPEIVAVRGRATIVYDADRSITPADELVHAGTAYTDVPVRCATEGEFHPKLVAVLGADRAVVAVGSGNATSAGWHHNGEVWTTVAATTEDWPDTFHQLGAWLEALPGRLVIDAFGASRLRDAAGLLRAHPVQTTGPQLLHNLDSRIVNGLPVGPVDELGVASPFLDPGLVALGAVQHRLRPADRSTVVLTRSAVADPAKLETWATTQGNQIRLIDSDRYHHGKVVEWRVGDCWQALVGSANTTQAALLRSAAGPKGNCELSVLVESSSSLLGELPLIDAGEDGLVDHLSEPGGSNDADADGLQLLRVLLQDDELQVSVAHPPGAEDGLAGGELHAGSVQLPLVAVPQAEASDAGQPASPMPHDPPTAASIMLLSASAAPLEAVALAGLRCWLQLKDGRRLGPVLLTDAAEVLRRPSSSRPIHDVTSALARPELAEQLFQALVELASLRPDPVESGAGPTVKWRALAERSVGKAVTTLALGPAPPAVAVAATQPTGQASSSPTDGADDDHDADSTLGDSPEQDGPIDPGDTVKEDDNEDDGTDDELPDDEAAAGSTNAVSPIDQLNSVEKLAGAGTPQWLARRLTSLSEALQDWSLPAVAAVLRVTLLVAAADGFEQAEGVRGWVQPVGDLLKALADHPDRSSSELAPVRSAAGLVGLAALDTTIDWRTGKGPMNLYEACRQDLALDPCTIDAAQVRHFAADLHVGFGGHLRYGHLLSDLERLCTTSSLGRRVEALSTPERPFRLVADRLVEGAPVKAPQPAALHLLGQLTDVAPVAVRLPTAIGSLLAVWQPPQLVLQWRRGGDRQDGSEYRVATSPAAYASGGLPRPTRRWTSSLPPELAEQLQQAGLLDPPGH